MSAPSEDAVRAIANAWRILHVLGVSLAEAGRYEVVEGEESGRRAVAQIMDLPSIRSLLLAEDELWAALKILDPDLAVVLDEEAGDFTYWEGHDSPNVPPPVDRVSRVVTFDEDD